MVLPVSNASMVSCVSVVCCRTLWTSTTGLAPETVIVSASGPTCNCVSTLAVKPVASSIPSCRTVLNPGSVKMTV